jgi:hypothetical protein
MSGAQTVYLIDQVVTRPGRGREFHETYLQRYAPGAQARGMKLEQTLVAPPLWLEDQSNTLLLVWSLQGAAGFWAMSLQGRQDPALQDWWWNEAAPLIESRQRYIAGSVAGLAALNEV